MTEQDVGMRGFEMLRRSLFVLALTAVPAAANNFENEVERNCAVYFYSDDYGELDCRGDFEFLERSCEAYRDDPGDDYGYLSCRGEFRFLARSCSIYIYDGDYGDIVC